MSTILNEYNKRCSTKSDINEHLPTLKFYAEKCDTIVEFGLHRANSTFGLLAGKPKQMISIDPRRIGNVPEYIESLCKKENIIYKFIQKSSLDVNLETTDFLFIDSLHLGSHLEKELNKHASKISKYIGFHDTAICSQVGMAFNGDRIQGEGLAPIIQCFLKNNQNWTIEIENNINNGIIILRNKNANI